MKGYSLLDTLILRCPARPFQSALQYCAEPISSILEDALLEQAILLASPTLYGNLQKYQKLDKKKQSRCRYSLARYLVRSSSRSTPFGLFSGIVPVKKGESSTILIGKTYVVTPYLEMWCILEIALYFLGLKEVREVSHYNLNPTLYAIGDEYKFIESIITEGDIRHRFSSVKSFALLNNFLISIPATPSWKNLLACVCDQGYSKTEATHFLNDLIDNQILVPELFPNLTGESYLCRLSKFIQEHSILPHKMLGLNDLMRTLDSCRVKVSSKQLETIRQQIGSLIEKDISKHERCLCANLCMSVSKESSIGQNVLKSLEQVLTFLIKVSETNVNRNMERFKELFHEVYGDNEVPLFRVLDPETGLGYPVFQDTELRGSNFLYDFEPPQRERALKLNLIEATILSKISTSAPEDEIILCEEDFLCLKDFDAVVLPDSIFALFEIIKDHNSQSPTIRVISVGDNSSCNLLARFSNEDPALEELCKSALTTSSSKRSKIVAQIAHLPKARAGNVTQHPHLRSHEIPMGVSSTVSPTNIIAYQDLSISVIHGKIRLRSVSLGMDVVPSLNNAYDYSAAPLSIYRFLCDLQGEDYSSSINVSFENLRNIMPHLPRICYCNAIISPASWRVEGKYFHALSEDMEDCDLTKSFQEIFSKLGIPSSVYVEDGDNRLYLNITSPHSIRTSLSEIRKYPDHVLFSEVLYSEDSTIVRNEKGQGFSNECIAFFVKG
jgi:lantibiotic dehydratase domain protein